MAARSYCLILALVASYARLGSPAVCYNHQGSTYEAQFKPTYCEDTCTVTPFFSPDHSLDTYVNLIEEASESIDILTPGTYVQIVLHYRCLFRKYMYAVYFFCISGGYKELGDWLAIGYSARSRVFAGLYHSSMAG